MSRQAKTPAELVAFFQAVIPRLQEELIAREKAAATAEALDRREAFAVALSEYFWFEGHQKALEWALREIAPEAPSPAGPRVRKSEARRYIERCREACRKG